MDALRQLDAWPARNAAAAVFDAGATLGAHGDRKWAVRWASVTKLATALAALVAAEEGVVDLDGAAGPEGATIRHLLAHASGLPFEGSVPIARPGERRIYSNTGFDLLADEVATAAEMPFAEYLAAALLRPLGLSADLAGSAASGVAGSLDDLVALGRELLAPTLVARETLAEATSVQFPGLNGVLPGLEVPALDGSAELAPHVRALRRERHVSLGRPGGGRRLRLPHGSRVRRLGARSVAAPRRRRPRRGLTPMCRPRTAAG